MSKNKLKPLLPICYIEALERFAFLGFLGIFVFYLMDTFSFSKGEASAISASLGAAIYAFGIFGAYLSDFCLGAKRCVILGIIFLTLGYLCLTFDFLNISLFCIIFGSVLIKSNITSLLSKSYPNDSEYVFSMFYIFVNIGCFLGQISAGLLILHSYNLAFFISFFSVFCAILVFFYNSKYISSEPIKYDFFKNNIAMLILIFLFIAFLATQELLVVSKIISIFSILILIIFYIFIYRKIPTKNNFKKLAFYLIAAVFFYMLIFQSFNTLNILIKSKVSFSILNYQIPASWYLAFMFLVSIFTSMLLSFISKKSSINEALIIPAAMIIAASSFIVLGMLSKDDFINPIYILITYFMLGISQTSIGVLGLSIVSKLTPSGFNSSTMGIWFLCSGAAQGIEGIIAKYIDNISYELYFSMQGFLVLFLALLMLFAYKYLKV
ncbi:MFS transporter [Campylobacter sp. RM9333]|uniref:oligopeptide:H+ symporter n=1 Tax=Campylobacter sp. RM9333 TaxID=2735731 RepID=UPI001E0B05E2|nr:MFS transporter [Campylobacter sp. RM9333]